jgi:hypothetical protein
VRKAEGITRIAAADFSRIRNADLGRFTVDWLMTTLSRLGQRVDVAVTVWRMRHSETRLELAYPSATVRLKNHRMWMNRAAS